MTPRARLLLAVVAGAAVVLVLILWRTPDEPPPSTSSAGAPSNPTAPTSPPARGRLDPAKREAMIASLEAARARRDGNAPRPEAFGSGAGPAPALPPPVLDREYIQQQVRELLPLVKECYEQALAEQPGLGGKLIVEVAIGAEPDVGGLIESSKVLDDSTLVHAGMAECVRETMYAVEFVAPANGGRVVLRYPFVFSSP